MAMENNRYETLVEATEKLKERGYTCNFRVNEFEKLEGDNQEYDVTEVELHEFHRFEGNTNPVDTSIIYAVQTKSGVKGAVVDSYGADGSEITSKFMKTARQQFEERKNTKS